MLRQDAPDRQLLLTMTGIDTERVWTDMHAGLVRFVGRRVRHDADAEDIVQRVFLKVHESLGGLKDADRLHAWIYQVTRRAIADHYRSPMRRREVPMEPDAPLADVPAAPDDQADAEAGSEAFRELAACLHPLVAQLAAADQEALRLVEVEGLSQVEAADRLGLSVSGMKSRVQRARGRLRRIVEDCCRIDLDRRGGVIGYTSRRCDPCD